MAVPSSGELSLGELAKERVNFTSSGGYGSSQIAPTKPYSLADLSTSGNSHGNGFVVCPVVKVSPFPTPAAPYGMSEFYGYINNRDGDLTFQLGDNGPVYSTSTTLTGNATTAQTTYKVNLTADYQLTITVEIASLSWAELSTSSGFYDGTGSTTLSLTVSTSGTSFYLKLDSNSTTSTRLVEVDVYGVTQCQRVDDAYGLNITQAAASGGGGGGGLPPKGGEQ